MAVHHPFQVPFEPEVKRMIAARLPAAVLPAASRGAGEMSKITT